MSEDNQIVHPMINFLVSEISQIKLLNDNKKHSAAWVKMGSILDLLIPDLKEDKKDKAKQLKTKLNNSIRYISTKRGIGVQDTYSMQFKAQRNMANKNSENYTQEFMDIVWPYLKYETYGGMVYTSKRASQ